MILRLRRPLRVAVLCAILGASGCSDGSTPPPITTDGSADARVDAASDGGSEGGPGDGATEAGLDGSTSVTSCVASAPVDVVEVVGAPNAVDVDLAAGASDAMVVLRAQLAEETLPRQVVAHRLSGTTASSGMNLDVGPNGFVDRPRVVTRGADFFAAWSDTAESTILRAIHVRGVGATGTPLGSMPTRVGFTAGGDDHVALLPVANGTLAVFQGTAAGTSPTALLIDGENAITTGPTSITGTGLHGRTVLSAIGLTPFAVYVNNLGALRSVSIAADASGGGAPQTISMGMALGGGFDFASYDNGGAVVFEHVISGIRSEVHFRHLDTTGAATLGEPSLSGNVGEGHSPALAPIGGGYLVAYRHTEDGATTLRLMLIDHQGNEVDADDGPTLTSIDGDVRVRFANDGSGYVVYEELIPPPDPDGGMPSSTAVRFVRITCS